jgi:hypothetical protein
MKPLITSFMRALPPYSQSMLDEITPLALVLPPGSSYTMSTISTAIAKEEVLR